MTETLNRVKTLLGDNPIAGGSNYNNLPLPKRIELMHKRAIGIANLMPGYNNGFTGGNWSFRRPRARFDPMVLPAWARGVDLISQSIASVPREYKGDAKWTRILLMPNARTSEAEFWRLTMYFLLNFGNAFWVIIDGALYSRHPTTLLFDVNYDINKEGRMTYRFRDYNGHTEEYNEDEVLHFKANADNPYIALAPTQRYGLLFDGIQDAMEYGIKFFKNSAVAQGILTLPPTPGLPADNEMYTEFRQSWNDQYQGDNAHGIAIAPDGTKWTPMSVEPKKAMMLETNIYYIKVCAQLLGLQPYQLGDTSASTYNNMATANTAMVNQTLRPWLDRVADQLFIQLGVTMTFDLSSLLAGTRAEEIDVDLKMVEKQLMTAAEFRAKHLI